MCESPTFGKLDPAWELDVLGGQIVNVNRRAVDEGAPRQGSPIQRKAEPERCPDGTDVGHDLQLVVRDAIQHSAKFCEECATPLTWRCKSCGHPLSATAKFCQECARPPGATATQSFPSRFAAPETYTPKHLAERI